MGAMAQIFERKEVLRFSRKGVPQDSTIQLQWGPDRRARHTFLEFDGPPIRQIREIHLRVLGSHHFQEGGCDGAKQFMVPVRSVVNLGHMQVISLFIIVVVSVVGFRFFVAVVVDLTCVELLIFGADHEN